MRLFQRRQSLIRLRIPPLALCLAIAGLAFVKDAAAQNPPGFFVKSDTFLLDEADGKSTGQRLEDGQLVLMLGVAERQTWAKVMRRDGEEGWVPRDFLEAEEESARDGQYWALVHRFRMKHRVTTDFVLNFGASLGNEPFSYGAFVLPSFSAAPDGLFGIRIDQFEWFIGGAYHYDKATKKGFFELPIGIMWLLRPPVSGKIFFGPRLGLSVYKLPNSTADIDYFFRYGVHLRVYVNDFWGLMGEVSFIGKDRKYYEALTGLTMRF